MSPEPPLAPRCGCMLLRPLPSRDKSDSFPHKTWAAFPEPRRTRALFCPQGGPRRGAQRVIPALELGDPLAPRGLGYRKGGGREWVVGAITSQMLRSEDWSPVSSGPCEAETEDWSFVSVGP